MPILIKGSGGKKAKLQQKTATPSTSSQTISPDSGYDGLSKVTVSGVSKVAVSGMVGGVSGFAEVSGQMSFDVGETLPSDYPDSIELVFCGGNGYNPGSVQQLLSGHLLHLTGSTYYMYGMCNGLTVSGNAVTCTMSGSTLTVTLAGDMKFVLDSQQTCKYACTAVWNKKNV